MGHKLKAVDPQQTEEIIADVMEKWDIQACILKVHIPYVRTGHKVSLIEGGYERLGGLHVEFLN